jgi:hypothetical protein
MTANNVGFQEMADLASHLSLEEQARLVAWIGAGMNAAPTEFASGAPMAVLHAVTEPPHLPPEDVGELEQAIASGRLPVRCV